MTVLAWLLELVGVLVGVLAVVLLVAWCGGLAIGAWWRYQLTRAERRRARGELPPCLVPPPAASVEVEGARFEWGWIGVPSVELMGEGFSRAGDRLLRSLEAFDRLRCERLAIAAGEPINGASIPRPLWWLLGGPWSTPLRRASVVHDVEWSRREASSWTVHGRFYRLALADGCPMALAAWAWAAVVLFGGTWRAGAGPRTPAAIRPPTDPSTDTPTPPSDA